MANLRTSSLLQAVVAHLIAYVSDSGDSIGVICQDRVYIRLAPDNVEKPYQVIQVVNGETSAEDNNLREEFDLDVLSVSDDPIECELLADLAREALLGWQVSSAADGLIYVMHAKRETEPPGDTVTRDRCETRVIARCASWSRSLSDALT